MSSLVSLDELAHLATGDAPIDEGVTRALRIVATELAAQSVLLVYGGDDDFRYFGVDTPCELSQTALWLISRNLTTHHRPRSFRICSGRVVDFRVVGARSRRDRVAALLPGGVTSANMLIAYGPWDRGLSKSRCHFLQAALPSLGLLLQRRLNLSYAEREQKQLSTLVSVGRVISETEDLETMLTSIARTVASLTGVDYVTIDIVRGDGGLQFRCVNYDLPEGTRWRDRWSRGAQRPDPVRNLVMATRQPMIFEDAQSDERIPEAARNFFVKILVRSAAVFPLVVKDEVVGVLSVASLRPSRFDGQQQELLEGLAGQIATAVKGVNLYEERRRAEEELLRGQELLRATIESTADGILVVNSEGQVAYSNERFARMWGIPREILSERDDEKLLMFVLDQLTDPEAFLQKVRTLYQTTEEGFDTLLFKDGRTIERYSRPLLQGGQPTGRVWSFRDVTARKKAEEALLQQARHDALTKLLNHGAITEELCEQAALNGALGVVMADIDGMKAINDTYGHLVGDQVLVTVARALSRDGALVGRYGGDEFLVGLPGADRSNAEDYCRTILRELSSAKVRDPATGSGVPILASIGVAVYPTEADSIEDAIRLADNAMYREKRERSIVDGAPSVRSVLGDERAAKMVGEIVPLLTSPGRLDDKLRLVAHRLSAGAGYDVVRFRLAGASPDPATTTTFARPSADLIHAWDEERARVPDDSMRKILEETKRPIIVEDLLSEERYSDRQRELLRAAGVRSALIVPMLWQGDVVGILSVASRRETSLDARDARFLTAVADQVTAIIRMAKLVDDLEEATSRLQAARADTVILLAAAAEAHDPTTGRHLKRVRMISEALARELSYEDELVNALGLAAVLHDIGKVRVPESILLSPSRLNGDEWELMKQHTVWGAEFLRERPGFELAATIARNHHERWDGKGYPSGLAGGDIPEVAAIVAVADSFDAITSDRPYRTGRSLDWAMREIRSCARRQFSPRVVAALDRLCRRGDLSVYSSDARDGEEAA